jgi:hypothetical protein
MKSDPSALSQPSTISVTASSRWKASNRWSASILSRASDLAQTLELYPGTHQCSRYNVHLWQLAGMCRVGERDKNKKIKRLGSYDLGKPCESKVVGT